LGLIKSRSILYVSLILSLSHLAAPVTAGEPGRPFDEFGQTDAVRLRVEQVHGSQWIAMVELSNDENIAAMTLPLRWRPRGGFFRLDSASYDGLRTEQFALKTFYPDSVKQTVLIGLISDLGTGLPPLPPGDGPIARLHFTALQVSVKPLDVDTTFIRPHNVLQMVTPDVSSILPVFERR
jgi:hypothetical protein